MDIGVIISIILFGVILYFLLVIIWNGILIFLGILRIIWQVVSFPFRCIFYIGAFLFGLGSEIWQYFSNRRSNERQTESSYAGYESRQESTNYGFENSGSASGESSFSGEQRQSYKRPTAADKEEQYLQILELSRQTLSQENLKKNYRRLAKMYHPDKNPGNRIMEEKFKLLAEAYDYFSEKI